MDMAGRTDCPGHARSELKCVDRRVDCDLKKLQDEYDYRTGEVPRWLAEEFRQKWADTWKGGRPRLSLNRHNKHLFSVWAYGGDKEEPAEKEDEKKNNEEEKKNPDAPRRRFKLVRFCDLRPGMAEQPYLIDELIPAAGIVGGVGAAEMSQSFTILDMMLHVSKGWEYRDRYVRQGAVVYCAFEGAHGYRKRIAALRKYYGLADDDQAPLYIISGQANLINDHPRLIAEIRLDLGADAKPAQPCSTPSTSPCTGPDPRTPIWEPTSGRRKPSATASAASSSSSIIAAMKAPARAGTRRCPEPTTLSWP